MDEPLRRLQRRLPDSDNPADYFMYGKLLMNVGNKPTAFKVFFLGKEDPYEPALYIDHAIALSKDRAVEAVLDLIDECCNEKLGYYSEDFSDLSEDEFPVERIDLLDAWNHFYREARTKLDEESLNALIEFINTHDFFGDTDPPLEYSWEIREIPIYV